MGLNTGNGMAFQEQRDEMWVWFKEGTRRGPTKAGMWAWTPHCSHQGFRRIYGPIETHQDGHGTGLLLAGLDFRYMGVDGLG